MPLVDGGGHVVVVEGGGGEENTRFAKSENRKNARGLTSTTKHVSTITARTRRRNAVARIRNLRNRHDHGGPLLLITGDGAQAPGGKCVRAHVGCYRSWLKLCFPPLNGVLIAVFTTPRGLDSTPRPSELRVVHSLCVGLQTNAEFPMVEMRIFFFSRHQRRTSSLCGKVRMPHPHESFL